MQTFPLQDTSSPLDELEDFASPSLSDDFSSLNALLTESLASRAESVRIKEQRQLLATGKIPKAERDGVSQLIRSWELKKEWVPVAAVQMYHCQTCSNCGGQHYHYEGVYQRQVNKISHKISRWIKSDSIANSGLAKEAKCEDSTAPVCADCSEFFEDKS